MAGIPLNAIGSAIVKRNPPWAYSLFTLARSSFPKGLTPPHLQKYQATGMNENLRRAQARVKAMATGRSKRRR